MPDKSIHVPESVSQSKEYQEKIIRSKTYAPDGIKVLKPSEPKSVLEAISEANRLCKQAFAMGGTTMDEVTAALSRPLLTTPNYDLPCIKCDNNGPHNIQHLETEKLPIMKEAIEECIRCVCERCGYHWTEKTHDQRVKDHSGGEQ